MGTKKEIKKVDTIRDRLVRVIEKNIPKDWRIESVSGFAHEHPKRKVICFTVSDWQTMKKTEKRINLKS